MRPGSGSIFLSTVLAFTQDIDSATQGFFRCPLQSQVHSSVNLKTELIGRGPAVAFFQELAHVLDIIRRKREIRGRWRRRQFERFLPSIHGLSIRNEMLIHHALEHVPLTNLRLFQALDWRAPTWCRRETSQQCCFSDGKGFRLLTKVLTGCSLDPVSPTAEVDLVEVEREDIRLTQMSLQSQRQDDLLRLAAVVPLPGQKERSDDLLCDCTATLHRMSGTPVVSKGSENRGHIHSPMTIEVCILSGEKRLLG